MSDSKKEVKVGDFLVKDTADGYVLGQLLDIDDLRTTIRWAGEVFESKQQRWSMENDLKRKLMWFFSERDAAVEFLTEMMQRYLGSSCLVRDIEVATTFVYYGMK